VAIGLMLSVFTWGLQYKLSLYDPPQSVTHTIPEAKLLNKDGRTTVSQSGVTVDTRFPASFAVTAGIFFLCLLSHVASERPAIRLAALDPDFSSFMSNSRGLSAFSFRPPPSLL